MVKAAPKKRKSNANTDFKRVKRKVGKKAPLPSTHMDLSFKSKTVNVREQSVVADKTGAVVSSKNLSIGELLSKLKHHNGTVRKDALEGLLEILQEFSHSSQVRSRLPTIVTTVVEAINDDDRGARSAVRMVLEELLEISNEEADSGDTEHENVNKNEEHGEEEEVNQGKDLESELGNCSSTLAVHWCSPFFRLIMLHVSAGLSGLQMGKRLDALVLVELMTKYFPKRVTEFECELVPLYAALVNASLAQLGSRRSTPVTPGSGVSSSSSNKFAPDGTSNVTITRRSGGILANFKEAQKNAKGAGKRKKVAGKKQVEAKAGGQGRGPNLTGHVGPETWMRVTHSCLRLMQHVTTSPDAAGKQRNRKASRFAFRNLRPNTQALQPMTSADAANGCNDKSQSSMDSHNSSGLGNAGAGKSAELVYATALPAMLSLWTQSCALYIGSCNATTRVAEDKGRMRDYVSQLHTAAELLLLFVRRALACSSGARTTALAALTEGVDKVIQAAQNLFPIQNTLNMSHYADEFMRINMLFARVVLRIASANADGALHDVKVQPLNASMERVCKWVAAEFARRAGHTPAAAQAGLLERLVAVAQEAVLVNMKSRCGSRKSDGSPSSALGELFASITGCFNDWFDAAEEASSGEEVITVAAPLLRSAEHVVKSEELFCSIDADSLMAWTMCLPKVAWQACQERKSIQVARSAFQLLGTLIARAASRNQGKDVEEWERVAKWLTPIMFTLTRSSKQDVFGPFISNLDIATKLQYLDLLASLPLERLPDSTLRALAITTDGVQAGSCAASQTVLPCDQAVIASRSMILSRMVQVPFILFRRAARHKEANLQIEMLVDIVSFSVTVLWGGRGLNDDAVTDDDDDNDNDDDDDKEKVGCQKDTKMAIAHCSDEERVLFEEQARQIDQAMQDASVLMVAEHLRDNLRALQCENEIPMAQLMYPLIFQLLSQQMRPDRAGDNLGCNLVMYLSHVEEEGEQNSASVRRANLCTTQARVLRLARAVCYLHRPETFDEFPEAFLRSLLLAVAFICCTSAENPEYPATQSHAGFIVLSDLVRLTHPIGLAEPLALLVNELQAHQSLKDSAMQAFALALRVQGSNLKDIGSKKIAKDLFSVKTHLEQGQDSNPVYKMVLRDIQVVGLV